jgi:hypothetical protein
MLPEFLRMELSPSRVFVVVVVNFRMTFKAHSNSVCDVGRPIVCALNDVVDLHLHAAEPMAKAAATVTSYHQRVCIFLFETGHYLTSFYRQQSRSSSLMAC